MGICHTSMNITTWRDTGLTVVRMILTSPYVSSYIFKCLIYSHLSTIASYVLICHPYGEDVKPWAPSKALDIILPVRSESEHLEATFPVFFFFLDLSFTISTILLATFKHFKTHGMEEENSPGEEDSQKIDICSPRREERSAESDLRFCLGYQKRGLPNVRCQIV